MAYVYLIHFNKKLHHAQHYIGYTKSLNERLDRHKSFRGARILHVLNNKNIEYAIVRIWKNVNKQFERKLKNRKNSKRLCPICNPNNWTTNGRNK